MIKVVYGAPLSGKTTYCRENMKAEDLRFDYDALLSAVRREGFCKDSEFYSSSYIQLVKKFRKLIINHDHEGDIYITTTKVTENLLSDLKGKDYELIHLEASVDELLDRLEADESRPDKDYWIDVIASWLEWFDKWSDSQKKGGESVSRIEKFALTQSASVTPSDMELINKHTLKELKPEDVFIFKLAICDNEVDRDHEVFPRASLDKLAQLFNGRTVICDHEGSTKNQVARIFKTEVVEKDYSASSGEIYSQLIAYCYIPRTDKNVDIINDIESGIKSECSVSCSIRSAVCSVCGIDNRQKYCDHFRGKTYNGKLCYFKLNDPVDAYEVSFVAIPAQPKAGVTKNYGDNPIEENVAEIEETEEIEKNLELELELVGSFLFKNKRNEVKENA